MFRACRSITTPLPAAKELVPFRDGCDPGDRFVGLHPTLLYLSPSGTLA